MGVFTPAVSAASPVALAVASTDYTALAARPLRRFLLIQNTDAAAVLSINCGSAAAVGGALVGLILKPGQALTLDMTVPESAIHIASDTANAAYFVLEG